MAARYELFYVEQSWAASRGTTAKETRKLFHVEQLWRLSPMLRSLRRHWACMCSGTRDLASKGPAARIAR